jgi:hypothetical protein
MDSVTTPSDLPHRSLLQSPLVSAALLALLGTAFWFVLESIAAPLGGASNTAHIDGVFVMLLFLQVGYYIAIVPRLRRNGRRCLDEITPLLSLDPEQLSAHQARFNSHRLPRLAWTLPLGALITFVMQEAQFSRFSLWISNPDLALGELWTVLAAWLTWGLGLSAASLVIADANAMRKLGKNYIDVDLLRIDKLAAFSRYGLHLAGATVGLMTLWAISLVLISTFVGIQWGDSTLIVGMLMVAGYICLSVGVFIFPQVGVREHIHSKKDRLSEELTLLLPSANSAGSLAGHNPERVAAILSTRSQIQAIPEWPAGQHTRLRLAVYLLVPLLSWSAAALVEEFVSHLLS